MAAEWPRRKRQMAVHGAFFFINFDIFSNMIFSQHLRPDACSVVRGQQFRAKNIKDTKKHFQTFFRIANIFVQNKGIAQCFFSTKVRATLLEKLTQD